MCYLTPGNFKKKKMVIEIYVKRMKFKKYKNMNYSINKIPFLMLFQCFSLEIFIQNELFFI